MLQRYPNPDDWKHIQFSDLVHPGYGPSQTTYVIRKPGQRYCPGCICHNPPGEDKSTKREHAWAAVGWNFKSDLIFYEAKSPNGKMSHEVYVNQILEPVKPWFECGDDFVLEEDGGSGHGGNQHAWKGADAPPPKTKRSVAENPVQCWKRENGLKFYFNCHSPSDFSPIENCW